MPMPADDDRDIPRPGPDADALRARTGFPWPPRGTSPNCGPERRFNAPPVDSAERFVEVARDLVEGSVASDRLQFDDYRRPPPAGDKPGGKVDWEAVLGALVAWEDGGVAYFMLKFTPARCSGYTLILTSFGAGAVYGCCGK